MRFSSITGAAFVVAAAVAFANCGGGGESANNSSPSQPSPAQTPSPSTSGAVTINIATTNGGANAFQPNPMTVAAGQSMVWKNNTNDDHHIVMDDGSGDSGTIKPGASSGQIPLKSSSGNYHCTIHPSMVGSINGSTAPDPGSPSDPPGYVTTR